MLLKRICSTEGTLLKNATYDQINRVQNSSWNPKQPVCNPMQTEVPHIATFMGLVKKQDFLLACFDKYITCCEPENC